MPRRTYVDNAMNRSLGRVGMPLGSCVHSSSSSGFEGSSGYGSSSYSSPQRSYVDNAMNRSHGRVGKPVGSHVVHRDGSATVSSTGSRERASGGVSSLYPSERSYVDNAMNQSLGRVGKPVGSHVVHRDGSATVSSTGSRERASGGVSSLYPSERSYVDNAMNRSLGRVGKPVGSHVVHRDGSATVSSTGSREMASGGVSSLYPSERSYVDNAMNRSLGRVGKSVGSHVVHEYTGSREMASGGVSSLYPSERSYVDNAMNRSLGRVGKPVGSHVVHKDGSTTVSPSSSESTCSPSSTRRYVDSSMNRRLGHVGKPTGYHLVQPSPKCYIDNAYNRKRGRVGRPITHRRKKQHETEVSHQRKMEQELLCERNLDEILHILRGLNFSDHSFPAVVNAQCELQRIEIEESWKKSGISPSTNYSKVAEIKKEIIPLAEIEITNKIGEGGFGKVYAGLWKNVPIAFKKFIYQHITKKKQEQLLKEIKIFSRLSHANIVKMFGVVMEKDNMGIVMEYLPKTLYHAIFIDEIYFNADEKKKIISEIVCALDYLHTPMETPLNSKPKIAHCDVKSQNILLDACNVAKLCDFGLSAMKNTMQSSSSRSLAAPGQGTPRYAAPEVLQGKLLSMSELIISDIYSLSLVLYEVLVEEEPYEDLGICQLIENVGRGSMRPVLEETSLTAAMKELLMRSWDREPGLRPDIRKFSDAFSKIDRLVTEDKQLITQ